MCNFVNVQTQLLNVITTQVKQRNFALALTTYNAFAATNATRSNMQFADSDYSYTLYMQYVSMLHNKLQAKNKRKAQQAVSALYCMLDVLY